MIAVIDVIGVIPVVKGVVEDDSPTAALTKCKENWTQVTDSSSIISSNQAPGFSDRQINSR